MSHIDLTKYIYDNNIAFIAGFYGVFGLIFSFLKFVIRSPVLSCDGNTRTSLVVVVAGKKAETEKSGEELGEQEG